MNQWVRGHGTKPEARRIVLSYKTAKAEFKEVEDLIQHIPFGKQNEVLLECIRMAAPAMLKALLAGQPAAHALAPTAPAIAPTKVEAAPPAPPAFSNAALSMLEMGDTSGAKPKT